MKKLFDFELEFQKFLNKISYYFFYKLFKLINNFEKKLKPL